MNIIEKSGSYNLGSNRVRRFGYGAMQLAGPGVFGPPEDKNGALAVLRHAVESGVNHIDTSDFYGPHVTNQLIKEALYPYSDDLTIVTKVGASRGEDASWHSALTAKALTQAVHDNLRHLQLDVLDVVNLRIMFNVAAPSEGSIEEPLTALIKLQEQGLIKHIGLSNVTRAQIAEAQKFTTIACVQNMYNIVHRQDDSLIDELASQGIAFVPFFPLGGFSPVQSTALQTIAESLAATPMQVALAWLLHRSPNILLIPGTSSMAHFNENSQAAGLTLSTEMLQKLDALAT
ncbi:oxidoreductase [Pantoea alhagi]|uniref:Oxidoreductase n=1 Tax=Pantoea alhagi TaxID=1891675 RepID=A0A1W6B7J1_9GAMM|nr:aldo/keto reductase family oxidoreductase [Pantoea alhagi]ARJ43003.1 oxidoreductase [Pantoea alhagi]